jgi:hypothetical protein
MGWPPILTGIITIRTLHLILSTLVLALQIHHTYQLRQVERTYRKKHNRTHLAHDVCAHCTAKTCIPLARRNLEAGGSRRVRGGVVGIAILGGSIMDNRR